MAAIPSVPYAILPSIEGMHFDDNQNLPKSVDRRIMTVSDNRVFECKNMFLGHSGEWCIGSSGDWLFLVDANAFPSLLNPSSALSIRLPNFQADALFPSVLCLRDDTFLLKKFVSKAALIPSPSPSQYKLVIIYGCLSKLAFCTEHGLWLQVPDANGNYCDIAFSNNYLYALGEDGSIEGWEWGNDQPFPKKKLHEQPSMEIDEEEDGQFSNDLFSSQLYLVMLEGKFFMLKRYIGNFVNADGLVVFEGHWDDDEICPYRTKHFVVYKLNLSRMRWEKTRSLEDRVVFVGANESTSVAAEGFEPNSIYFSDDRCHEMSLDGLYGGHDWGVSTLQDCSVKLLTPGVDKMNPPPIWVIPTSHAEP